MHKLNSSQIAPRGVYQRTRPTSRSHTEATICDSIHTNSGKQRKPRKISINDIEAFWTRGTVLILDKRHQTSSTILWTRLNKGARADLFVALVLFATDVYFVHETEHDVGCVSHCCERVEGAMLVLVFCFCAPATDRLPLRNIYIPVYSRTLLCSLPQLFSRCRLGELFVLKLKRDIGMVLVQTYAADCIQIPTKYSIVK